MSANRRCTNQLVRQKVDRAAVSPIPGTTKVAQSADTGLFDIIDTPGADAVGMSGLREHEIALEAARSADFLLIMFDAVQGIKRGELDLFLELKALGKAIHRRPQQDGHRAQKMKARYWRRRRVIWD